MKKITVTINVDEDVILQESGMNDALDDAITSELCWLQDSGMSVESWEYVE